MYNSAGHLHQVFYRYVSNQVYCSLDAYSFRPSADKLGGSISIIICERHRTIKSAFTAPNVYYLTLHLPSSFGTAPVAFSQFPHVKIEISKTIRRAASVLTEDMQDFLNERLAHLYVTLGNNLAINARVEVTLPCQNELSDAFEKLMLNNGSDLAMMDQQMSAGMNMEMGMLKVGETGNNYFTDDPCTLCDRVIMETDERMKMNCGHYYHYTCFVEWFIILNRNSCPICRSLLVSAP